MRMLVCMDYSSDGERAITQITTTNSKEIAINLTQIHDEVYAVDFDQNYKPLIQDIVLHGCKI